MHQIIHRVKTEITKTLILTALISSVILLFFSVGAVNAQSTQSGSTGLTGSISAPPPSEGPTITFPVDDTEVDDIPIVVQGLCPTDPADLLVKLFKNNVFSGSVQCVDGSWSIQTDLFVGDNELIARVYDDLDQPGPDSNIVEVEYDAEEIGAPVRVSLTSNYAKRGAFPNETLTWPVQLSGGTGPYAFSVDWGDGSEQDLFTESFPGTIDLSHVYKEPGVYNIIVKVVDTNGSSAFLQLVGVANGPLSQDTDSGEAGSGGDGAAAGGGGSTFSTGKTRIIWWPAALVVPFAVSTFWLGRRYMLHILKKRIERGEHPFADL